jgi:hypothetical protein
VGAVREFEVDQRGDAVAERGRRRLLGLVEGADRGLQVGVPELVVEALGR